jgi:predicted dehydrogenase
LERGFHVLVEKPVARTAAECDELIALAKERGVVLAVFQQSFFAPFYTFAKETVAKGLLGDVKQVSIHYNGFARRWDWQTLQYMCAGGLYNTGPHPVGLALGFLDFDKDARVEFSRLGTALTSGDADDYAKLILSAPGKPTVDVEVISCDAYSDYNLKLMGSRGTFSATTKKYKCTYIAEGENPARPVQRTSLADETGAPKYCSEKLIKHVEESEFGGTAFDVGSATLYRQLYFAITEGKPMEVTPQTAREIIRVIETAHEQNPLPVKFSSTEEQSYENGCDSRL